MAPSTQGQAWSEILCCPVCGQLFSETREPISTSCGHVFCRVCALAISGSNCPIDETENGYPIRELPTNSAILSVVGVQKEASQEIKNLLKKYGKEFPSTAISSCEKHLLSLASYMRRANSERGGSVWSELLSRTIQRKLVSVLCAQIVESNCRLKLMRTLRALAERIISEQLLQQQASHNLSTQLWTTVRSRGCQFLGPAMQEDVLKLILLTLSKGALIARKTLVMYIVQTLGEDYPQVSKTCVGHVVQLLYRASCFNVIKREGESSLMQLKEEFRTYEALRREHDTQIVGMAADAGLRILPDQWSALLYGDPHHRSHMQSIIDKLQNPQSFAQGIEELKTSSGGISDKHKESFFEALQIFEKISEDDSWERLSVLLEQMNRLIEIHVEIMIHRRELKSADYSRKSTGSQSTNNNRRMPKNNNHFKTKVCRETTSKEVCARGDSCSFVHSPHELRRDGPPPIIGMGMNGPSPSLQNIPPPMNGFPYQSQQHQLITEMQGMTMNPMLSAAPFVQIPTQPPLMSQQKAPMMSMMMQMGAPGLPISIDGTIPLGPAIPPPIVMMQPPTLWNGRGPPSQPPPPLGTALILQQIPQQIPQMPWIQQVPIAEYPRNAPTPGLYWSAPPQIQVLSPQPINFVQQIPMMIPPPIDYSIEKTSGDETELLHLKRIEILNRLAPLSSLDEEVEEGDGRGHVSYTVASSVLDDSHRHPSFIGMIPINNGNVPLDLPSVPCNVFSCNTDGDLPNFIPTLRIPSGVSPIMATVQADCSSMTVKDAIRQPITATMITPHVTVTSPSTNPIQQLPTRIIRPIEIPMIAGDAQHFVSQTLDKIVDVKERLTEVGGPSSSVESEQLRVELLIADRQMYALDPHTQQTCLLIELEEVERKIEELGGNHPPQFTPANVMVKDENCTEPKAASKTTTKPQQ